MTMIESAMPTSPVTATDSVSAQEATVGPMTATRPITTSGISTTDRARLMATRTSQTTSTSFRFVRKI